MNTEDFIPYGKQYIDEEDIREVEEVLASDWITQGPLVVGFEEEFARNVGAEYAVACSSGTAALHLAALAAGFGPGDRVLTSPITFLASANCARYVGADVDFVDIDPGTICLDPQKLAEYISTGPHSEEVKGIIPVHYAGIPCDMSRIQQLAGDKDIIIIEDACHALGASYLADGEEVRVGSCRHSDMCVFSFHPVKHITTGEGGMVTTNNCDLYNKLLTYRNHGIVKNGFLNDELAYSGPDNSVNPWYYEMQYLGFNYRITDIQCALGLSQMRKLQRFVSRRCEIASTYLNAFQGRSDIGVLTPPENVSPSWHLFPIMIDFNKLGLSRLEVIEQYRKDGIGVQVHYIPVHFQPYYSKLYGFKKGILTNAESYYESCLSIPLYPKMKQEEVERVIKTTDNILDKGSLC